MNAISMGGDNVLVKPVKPDLEYQEKYGSWLIERYLICKP
jgi:hypothetical protein